MIITGITAYAKDQEKGIIYLVTYGAKLLSFHPQKEGIGPVEDLGGVIDTGDAAQYRPYVPNLNVGDNGKLYYIIGGHGNYVKKNTTVLVEFDPDSGQQTILFEYPVTAMTEATGSDIKDQEGNLYFAGRRAVAKTGEKISPFLVKFNPEKEVHE